MRDSSPQPSEVAAFLADARQRALAPVWDVIGQLVDEVPAPAGHPHLTALEPRPRGAAHLWPFAQTWPMIERAGGLIGAREAERRLLLLQNPTQSGLCAAGSMCAGLQLVLPGETVRSHRHMQTAVRVGVYGGGAYTQVEGRRETIEPGDILVTPPWQWHHHGSEGGGPTVWLDALDIFMVRLYNANFLETDTREAPDASRTDGAPFKIEYAQTRARLADMARRGEPDAHAAYTVEHGLGEAQPLTTTLSVRSTLVPAGFRTQAIQSLDNRVFVAIEGEGSSVAGGVTLPWRARDVFAVPGWLPLSHAAVSDAVLVCVSDRAAMQKLGLWRERKLEVAR